LRQQSRPLAHAIALEVVTPSLSQGTAAKTTLKSCQKYFPIKQFGTSLTVRSRGRRIFRNASDIPSAAPLNSGVRQNKTSEQRIYLQKAILKI
jgi:hypothetical protein